MLNTVVLISCLNNISHIQYIKKKNEEVVQVNNKTKRRDNQNILNSVNKKLNFPVVKTLYLMIDINKKHSVRANPTVIKRVRLISGCFLINLKLCKPVCSPFEAVDNSASPPFLSPDSVVLSCRLQKSEGHVWFSLPPVPLPPTPLSNELRWAEQGQKAEKHGSVFSFRMFAVDHQCVEAHKAVESSRST